MLANEPPFTGAPAAVLHAQAYEQPRPLHIINPGISVPLSEAIGRMLSKGLELRYNTGAEFTRALGVAIEGTAPVRAPATAAAQMKEAGLDTPSLWQRPWVWIVIVMVIIGILLTFGFWLVSVFNARQPVVVASPSPTVIRPATTPTSPPTSESEAEKGDTPAVAGAPAASVESTQTPTTIPGPTTTPVATPTPLSLPTPGSPTIAENSPFNNLMLARDISEDNEPRGVDTSFAPGSQPIYLFFDYNGIDPGANWAHRWTWGDTELGAYEDTWPENYHRVGTAWVFYSPTGGYQPGPYKVTLEVNGQIVATATFVIRSGP
jgi:hypothetical protein